MSRVWLTAVWWCFRAVIGEIDEETDSTLDLGNIRAEPLNSVVHWPLPLPLSQPQPPAVSMVTVWLSLYLKSLPLSMVNIYLHCYVTNATLIAASRDCQSGVMLFFFVLAVVRCSGYSVQYQCAHLDETAGGRSAAPLVNRKFRHKTSGHQASLWISWDCDTNWTRPEPLAVEESLFRLFYE